MRPMPMDCLEARWRQVLWALVGAALLIRLWGTWYGLPFTYYNDEYHEVMRALQLGTGSFNVERNGKGGLYFILFLEYAIYFIGLKLAGVVHTAREFGEHFASDPSAFYLMGRITVAVFGAMTVAAVFYLGRRAYSIPAGLLAGLFVALNVLHIDLSRLIGLDVMMTLLAAISLYFGLGVVETHSRRDYVLAALFAALATTTKLPGILLLLPLLAAHTYAVRGAGGGVRSWFGSGNLWLAAVVFSGVLIATNPGIVNIADYVSLFAEAPGDGLDDDAMAAMGGVTGSGRTNLYLYYLDAVRSSMGWPLFLLAGAGVVFAGWRRTPADVILVGYAAITYLVIAATTSGSVYYPRYALPVIVVLLVLAGRALAFLLAALPYRRGAIAAASAVILVAMPLDETVSKGRAFTQTDSRTVALEWFETHVPSGKRVLIEGGKIGPMRSTVPLRDTAAVMRQRIDYWKRVEPKQAKLIEYRLAVHQGGGYDLELVRAGSVASLDQYAGMGIEYFVIRPDVFVASKKAGTVGQSFLEELRTDPRVSLIQRFDGVDDARLSPTIEIYRLNAGQSAPVSGARE